MPSAIQSQDLVVRVPGRAVLNGFTLSVPAGCIYGLWVPAGAARASFMNACAGLAERADGVLSVAGAVPARGRLDVGYCTQYDSFYEELTVDENVSFFGHASGHFLDGAGCSTRRVIESLRFIFESGQLAGLLSGGQKRRLNVVLACLGQPAVLLVDEPTVAWTR